MLAFESSDRRSVHYVHEAGSFVPLAQATRQGPIALTASVGVKELMGPNGRYDIDRDPLWNGAAEAPTGPGFGKEEIAYYQVDHLGTPQELTDHEGQIAWAAQYKAWGQAKEVISEAARRAGIANPIRSRANTGTRKPVFTTTGIGTTTRPRDDFCRRIRLAYWAAKIFTCMRRRRRAGPTRMGCNEPRM